jgi:BioD-like phosphotransacetylase family protein
MSILAVVSSEPRAGRSLIAAALAYRMARDGAAVTLARVAGDESAPHDARAFASIEQLVTPTAPVAPDDVKALTGGVVIELPAGSAKDVVAQLDARAVVVGGPSSTDSDVPAAAVAARVITNVPAAQLDAVAQRGGVVAVLAEDRVLAAPSVADIAASLGARTLHDGAAGASIDRVMIGTVASDAASPYFGNRERTCVITRFDKTDIQLAALLTDVQCMILTGGGESSPYLIDRVQGRRDGTALLLVNDGTVNTMRAIEGLYGGSRFDGEGKLLRAVELLDAAGAPVDLGTRVRA